MRAARYFAAVDSHTEGMPTRVVTGGVGPIPGATMLERKLHFETELDDLRLLLMREPRGHGAMSGAILQPPARDDADWGVLFIEVSGCLPMCGHGTIGVATVLVETGMVAVTEPETVVRLDVPAGLVEARVQVEHGRARVGHAAQRPVVPARARPHGATCRARASRLRHGLRRQLLRAHAGRGRGPGGRPGALTELIEAGQRVMAAINAADRPEHPDDPRIAGCHHVVFHAPGRDGADARAATSIHPGWLDRSPVRHRHVRAGWPSCTPAARSRWGPVRQRVGDRHALHRPGWWPRRPSRAAALVPEITGRAWITAMGQYLLDAEDPFPAGFTL